MHLPKKIYFFFSFKQACEPCNMILCNVLIALEVVHNKMFFSDVSNIKLLISADAEFNFDIRGCGCHKFSDNTFLSFLFQIIVFQTFMIF